MSWWHTRKNGGLPNTQFPRDFSGDHGRFVPVHPVTAEIFNMSENFDHLGALQEKLRDHQNRWNLS